MSIAQQVLESEAEEVLQEHGFPLGIATHEPTSVHVLVTIIAGVVDEIRVFHDSFQAETEYYKFWLDTHGITEDEEIAAYMENVCDGYTCNLETYVEVE